MLVTMIQHMVMKLISFERSIKIRTLKAATKMTKWSTDQLVFVTTAYLSQGKSIVSAQRSFKTKFNMRSFPSKKVIYRAVNNFSSTGNLEKKKPGQSAATATAAPNVEKGKEIIGENPNVSVRHLAQQLRTSIGSTHSILRKK